MAQLFGRMTLTETPVVVNASSGRKERVVDTVADTHRLAEIHRCALHGENFSCRTSRLVKWCIGVSKHLQHMVIHTSAAFSGEVEIRMVGHRYDGWRIGLCLIMDDEAVVLGSRVGHIDIHVSGVALLAVFGAVAECYLKRALCRHFPYLGVEPLHTAVQTVGAVVNGQLVLLAVQRELAVFDAVCHTSADGIEIRLLGPPFLRCAEAKDDILDFPFAVGYQQSGNLRAEITGLRFQTAAAFDSIELYLFHSNSLTSRWRPF